MTDTTRVLRISNLCHLITCIAYRVRFRKPRFWTDSVHACFISFRFPSRCLCDFVIIEFTNVFLVRVLPRGLFSVDIFFSPSAPLKTRFLFRNRVKNEEIFSIRCEKFCDIVFTVVCPCHRAHRPASCRTRSSGL